jgi:hypothetical protein
MADRAVRQQDDANDALRATRTGLHFWPFVLGALALTPVLSTETGLLVWYGLPYWGLGVALIAGGLVLLAGRGSNRWLERRWILAAGDLVVGTECLTMAAMMAIASAHGHASWLSVGLWLFPGLMFQLQCVLRVRGQ